MRALAHVITRGPASAAVFVMLACLMPMAYFLGAAALALIILRKGFKQAGMLTIVGVACGLIWYKTAGDINVLLTLGICVMAAVCLRETQSWQHSLLLITGASIASYFLLLQFASANLEQLVVFFNQMKAQLATQESEQTQKTLFALLDITVKDAASFTALSVSYFSTLGLIIARWWQASLYNPGGFASEFQALRIHPGVAIALTGLAVLAISQQLSLWALIITLPLFIAGIALVHAYVNWKDIGSHWLIIFYILLLLGNGLKMGLVFLAIIDSQVDFRKRWQALSSQ